MSLAILQAELIFLIIESVEEYSIEVIKEEGDDDGGDSYSDSDSEGKVYPDDTPLTLAPDPEIVLRETTSYGERRVLNTGDLNALARTCRALYRIVNESLYKANRDFQSSSAVFWAAVAGRTETLERALHYDLSIDEGLVHDTFGSAEAFPEGEKPYDVGIPWRPVQFAAKFMRYETVHWLLDHGAAMDTQTKIEEYGSGPKDLPAFEDAARFESSVLYGALRRGDERLSSDLIRRGARLLFTRERPNWPHSPQVFYTTALHLAADICLYNVMALLVKERGVDPDIRRPTDYVKPRCWTTLHILVSRRNREQSIVAMLRLGADIEATSDCSSDDTPLRLSLWHCNWENALLLLSHGAKVNSEITSRFYCYCPPGTEVGLQLLHKLITEHGVNIHIPSPDSHRTVFHNACAHGDDSLMVFLLNHGADPNGPTKEEYQVPLELVGHGHSRARYARLVALLLDHGADPYSCVDAEGRTWLQTVGEMEDAQDLKELLRVLEGRELDLPWEVMRKRAEG